jgi:hypothetical protein
MAADIGEFEYKGMCLLIFKVLVQEHAAGMTTRK